MTLRVKATQRGVYDGELREAGDVFLIESEDQAGSWMEVVEAPKAASAPASKRSKPEPDKPTPVSAPASADDDI
jgi:hypothetical protein